MIRETVGTPVDAAFDALADGRRRRLLATLSEREPCHPADALRPDADAHEVRIEHRHVHLPKLEEAGFVEWDSDTNELWRGDRFDEVRPLLELLSDHDDELPDDWF